ncbi:MAG TPA: hypothetical protein VFE84_14625 [Patescibacteria group bacterium]|nr:hypothetical protein [Patescibacteria group bacterium]
MIRFLAIVLGVALIGCPAFLIYSMTVPVARFRVGGYVDFLVFAGAMSIIYGGVLIGVATLWAMEGRDWRRLRRVGVFKAGVWGVLAVSLVFVLGCGVNGMMTRGSFEKGVGNLWGLIVIFALVFGAMVSGGLALLIDNGRSVK